MASAAGGRADAAGAAASCSSCLAWGLAYRPGVCRACHDFTAPRYGHDRGVCGACHRTEPLKKGFCRLCWCQARLERTTGTYTLLAPHVRRVRHHQLFLMDTAGYRDLPRARLWRAGDDGRKPRPRPAGRPRPQHVQPLLFDEPIARRYRYGRVDLRSDPIPDNPWLAWGLHLAHELADLRGWGQTVRGGVQRTLIMLLAGHADTDLIRVSDFYDVVASRSTNIDDVVEILTTMGVVVDDRQRAFDRWLAAELDGLAPAIRRDARTWVLQLADGSPRTRPRARSTACNYLHALRPALADWSARYGHLREVTRDDVAVYLDALVGNPRKTAFSSLRSLFGWAKRTRVVFRNPTTRLRCGPPSAGCGNPCGPRNSPASSPQPPPSTPG